VLSIAVELDAISTLIDENPKISVDFMHNLLRCSTRTPMGVVNDSVPKIMESSISTELSREAKMAHFC
jgi:transcriptional antiterminator